MLCRGVPQSLALVAVTAELVAFRASSMIQQVERREQEQSVYEMERLDLLLAQGWVDKTLGAYDSPLLRARVLSARLHRFPDSPKRTARR